MTVNFTKAFQNQLEKWIDDGTKRQKFTLLFKASRDGCDSFSFHNTCDNKGPTVTVLYNTNNTVYGGYTSVSWQSNNAYSNDTNNTVYGGNTSVSWHSNEYSIDTKAFLFRLNYNGTFQPLKFPIKTAEYAIYGNSSHGPTFGGGHDLCTFLNTTNKTGNYFALNGNCNNPGHTYDMQGQDYNTFANGHLQVLDIEVYGVEESEYMYLQTPWRKNVDWTTQAMKELKETVETYKPVKDLNVGQARILLVGQVGAGKSSFFNTINSIYRGYITCQANSGSAEHSLTTVIRTYEVRNGLTDSFLNFRLFDTPGLEENQGVDVQDIGYILDGHVPDGYQFNPYAPLCSESLGFIASPKLGDKIHCVAFVIDGSSVDVMPDKVLEKMKKIQLRMNQKGIPQVVLLTKIDRICELVSSDISTVFSSASVQDCVEKVSMMMGLPRAHILPFKNYESEMELDTNINILALMSLRQILRFANDYLYNCVAAIKAKKLKELSIRE